MKKKICNFSTYYKALNRSNKAYLLQSLTGDVKVFLVLCYVIMIFTINFPGFLAIFAFAMSAVLSLSEGCSPSFSGAMPVSRKRRLLYDYLASLCSFLIFIAFMLGICLIVGGIVFIIVYATGGSSDVSVVLEEEDLTSISISSAWPVLYMFFFLLAGYFGGFCVGFMREKKPRIIFFVLFTAVNLALVVPVYMYQNTYLPWTSEFYKEVTLSWLYFALVGALAVGCTIASVLSGIRFYGLNRKKVGAQT